MLAAGLGKLGRSWERPEASQGARLCRWPWLGYFLSLAHGATFETAPRLKVEVEARSLAGTGPTAGYLEHAAGNGRDGAAGGEKKYPFLSSHWRPRKILDADA